MFKRKASRPSASRAVAPADPEVSRLRAEVAAKQAHAADLEADLIESQESLAAFQREFEARVGVHARRVVELQRQIEAARRAAFERLWQAQPFAPPFVDVSEQFRRAWQHTEPPPAPPPTTPDEEAEVKALYRELAKRYHPDLAPTEAEREWRTPHMTAVNAAYAARDLAALQAIAATPDDVARPAPPIDSRAALIASLQRESRRLDELIARLEKELDELTYSPALKLELDVKLARRAGQDLLGETAAALKRDIARLEVELQGVLAR
ncbi:MAG: hypothetical protein HY260_08070 [Chloroflexi bacterium]|nr:hypothetical protein [Chloroflexota bacterium]